MTALPSGGVSLPNWRPGDVVSASASDIASGSSSSEVKQSYIDWMKEAAAKGDKDAINWMANYEATRSSEKAARDWTAQREDHAYQRLVDDLKAAGISPYILSGATPMVSNSTGKSYSGTEVATGEHNRLSKSVDAVKQVFSTLAMLGIMLLRFA